MHQCSVALQWTQSVQSAMPTPAPGSAVASEAFMQHVRDSCLRPFTTLYYTVGLVEEAAELAEQLRAQPAADPALVLSEVGDCLWYLWAVCNSLADVHPVLSDEAKVGGLVEAAGLEALLLARCGALCSAVKKWSRGDQSWEVFQPRLQAGVTALLDLLAVLSPAPLELAMRGNIEKIRSRRERGVVRGDGNTR